MTGMASDDGEMDRRVSFLEKSFEKIDSKLDRLIETVHAMNVRLARIADAMTTKASASEVSDLRGSMRSLPTVRQLITLVFGVLAGAFAIVRFGLPHP